MYNTICLLNKTDPTHLASVKSEMKMLGSPTIKAIADHDSGQYLACEGSHRITAAIELGLTINLELVYASDDIYLCDDLGIEDGDYMTTQDVQDLLSKHDALYVVYDNLMIIKE